MVATGKFHYNMETQVKWGRAPTSHPAWSLLLLPYAFSPSRTQSVTLQFAELELKSMCDSNNSKSNVVTTQIKYYSCVIVTTQIKYYSCVIVTTEIEYYSCVIVTTQIDIIHV